MVPDRPPSAPSPKFSALDFFAGDTSGEGRLKVIVSKERAVLVRGRGQLGADRTLLLFQTVEEAGRPSKKREWQIRETSPGRYVGTLSDATGPISGDAVGNVLHLHFRMKGGLVADQRLTLLAGARTADNVMVVRKLGLVVGVLHERITKLDR